MSREKGWGSNGAKQCHENKRMLTNLMTQNAISKLAMSEGVVLTLPSRRNHDNVSNVGISLSESLSLSSQPSFKQGLNIIGIIIMNTHTNEMSNTANA